MSKKINKKQKLVLQQPTENIGAPHDMLFKSMCGNKEITIDLIKSALPRKVFSKIDLSTLSLTDKSFVSPRLRAQHCDIIYQAEINGHEGYIAFLIEHQSTADSLMAFRKLEYNVGLMRQHLNQGAEKLPVIINICLYHGEKSPYPYSNTIPTLKVGFMVVQLCGKSLMHGMRKGES